MPCFPSLQRVPHSLFASTASLPHVHPNPPSPPPSSNKAKYLCEMTYGGSGACMTHEKSSRSLGDASDTRRAACCVVAAAYFAVVADAASVTAAAAAAQRVFTSDAVCWKEPNTASLC